MRDPATILRRPTCGNATAAARIVPKLSYVKGFSPWGWIIGTGIYIEDVAAERAALVDLIMSQEFRAGVYAFNLVQKRARKPAGAPSRYNANATSTNGAMLAIRTRPKLTRLPVTGSLP